MTDQPAPGPRPEPWPQLMMSGGDLGNPDGVVYLRAWSVPPDAVEGTVEMLTMLFGVPVEVMQDVARARQGADGMTWQRPEDTSGG